MTHVEIACRIFATDADTTCYSTLYDTSIEQNTTIVYPFPRWLIYSWNHSYTLDMQSLVLVPLLFMQSTTPINKHQENKTTIWE